jgi:hypothetical protein
MIVSCWKSPLLGRGAKPAIIAKSSNIPAVLGIFGLRVEGHVDCFGR